MQYELTGLCELITDLNESSERSPKQIFDILIAERDRIKSCFDQVEKEHDIHDEVLQEYVYRHYCGILELEDDYYFSVQGYRSILSLILKDLKLYICVHFHEVLREKNQLELKISPEKMPKLLTAFNRLKMIDQVIVSIPAGGIHISALKQPTAAVVDNTSIWSRVKDWLNR